MARREQPAEAKQIAAAENQAAAAKNRAATCCKEVSEKTLSIRYLKAWFETKIANTKIHKEGKWDGSGECGKGKC